MSGALPAAASRAAELRVAFDRAFAEPIVLDTAFKEDLLKIRIGAQACAIRLSEIAGLHADKRITAVPGSNAALRGIAGFRGAILPVYDLEILLGHTNTRPPRWLVIAAGAPVALAFGVFEGQLRVARDAFLPHASRQDIANYAREFVRSDEFVGPIMHVPSILDAIRKLENRGEAKRGALQS